MSSSFGNLIYTTSFGEERKNLGKKKRKRLERYGSKIRFDFGTFLTQTTKDDERSLKELRQLSVVKMLF